MRRKRTPGVYSSRGPNSDDGVLMKRVGGRPWRGEHCAAFILGMSGPPLDAASELTEVVTCRSFLPSPQPTGIASDEMHTVTCDSLASRRTDCHLMFRFCRTNYIGDGRVPCRNTHRSFLCSYTGRKMCPDWRPTPTAVAVALRHYFLYGVSFPGTPLTPSTPRSV